MGLPEHHRHLSPHPVCWQSPLPGDTQPSNAAQHPQIPENRQKGPPQTTFEWRSITCIWASIPRPFLRSLQPLGEPCLPCQLSHMVLSAHPPHCPLLPALVEPLFPLVLLPHLGRGFFVWFSFLPGRTSPQGSSIAMARSPVTIQQRMSFLLAPLCLPASLVAPGRDAVIFGTHKASSSTESLD